MTITIMGVSGLLCIFFLGSTFTRYASDYYAKTSFKDLEVYSNAGISENNISEIANVPGVIAAEGAFVLDGVLETGDKSQQVDILSRTEQVSVPQILEGRMPEKEDECALDPDTMTKLGISIGDKVSLSPVLSKLDKVMKNRDFTVTGTVIHPDYLLRAYSRIALLAENAFDREQLADGYLRAFVDLELKDNTQEIANDVYFENIRPAEEEIRELTEKLEKERTEEILSKVLNGSINISGNAADFNQIKILNNVQFVVDNRRGNEGYVKFQASVKAINGFGLIFIPMFAVIGCLVIFSTIAIMIDEQKRQVGALKALGFRKREIRNKYLIFGVSATVTGVVIGCASSLLLERIVLSAVSGVYTPGSLRVVFVPSIALLVCLPTIFTATVVVWLTCRNLLKSSAVGLMNGSEPAKRSLKKSSGRDRALYTHLIINNIVTEIPRVLVSIVVIVGCCLLIGIGFSLKDAFNKAFGRQENDIYRYDLRITENGDVNELNMEKIVSVMEQHNVSYLPVLYSAALYDTEGESAGFYILCGDSARLRDYVDTAVDIPDSGILIPEKFMESRTFSENGTMIIYDSELIPHEAYVSGSFPFYVGFTAVMSPYAYEEIFGQAPVYNSFYCTGSDEDINAVKEEIRNISPTINAEDKISFSTSYQSTKSVFNMVAWIMLLISLIIMFVIMINLNNILVNRRMKELLIMKINGFSNNQVIGYLLRETLLVNLIGIVLGIGIGIAMNGMQVRGVEPEAVMYVRSVSLLAWGLSAGINILTAGIINAISFRKVGKIPLTDITKY